MNEATCRHCRQPIRKLYPNALERLAWAHTSRKDSDACIRPPGVWPTPITSAEPAEETDR